jgi:hypothetical protein
MTVASVMTVAVTSRATWIENNARPDSIIMNIIGRSLLPPMGPRVWPATGLVARYTSKILNAIKVVTRAFTAKDRAILIVVTAGAQAGFIIAPNDV